MKYGFLILEIQDGEHGYYSHSVVEYKRGPIEKVAKKAAETWYDGEPFEWDEDEVDFIYMCVRVSVYQAREISKEHYDILKQYI